MRHAEVAPDVLVRLGTLLVADEHRAPAANPAEPADDRRVVAKQPVAVELDHFRGHGVHELERVRPFDVARLLDAAPDRLAHLVGVRRLRGGNVGQARHFSYFSHGSAPG
jgi:hypothetical protein